MSDEEGALFWPRRLLGLALEGAVSMVKGAVAVVDAPGGVGVVGAKTSSRETLGTTGSWLSSHTWLLHRRTWALLSNKVCDWGWPF